MTYKASQRVSGTDERPKVAHLATEKACKAKGLRKC
jgi:hypothetical protein